MGERLNAALVQHGARSARARGLPAADLQAHLTGVTVNLGVLAKNVAALRAATIGRSSFQPDRATKRGRRERARPGWAPRGRQLPLLSQPAG